MPGIEYPISTLRPGANPPPSSLGPFSSVLGISNKVHFNKVHLTEVYVLQ